MKTVNVFLASSEELELERDKFSDCVQQLNKRLKRRGIQINLERWEHFDASMGPLHKQEEYLQVLRNCEITLVLFWRRFGIFTKAEFETAYEELIAKRNLKKIYLFFKDASPEELQDELKEFKSSIFPVYGHFPENFSHVHTIHWRFGLYLDQYLELYEPLLTVKDGYVNIDNMQLVALANIPSVALNEDYQRMRREIDELEEEVAEYEQDCKENPQNEVKQSRLLRKRMKLEDKRNERDQHEQHLFNIAKQVAKLSGQRCDQRILQATKLFEEGKISEAVALLSMEDLNRDAEHILKNYHRSSEEKELWQQSAQAAINTYLLRAQSLQADLSISGEDRYQAVCESFNKALQLARDTNYFPQNLALEILMPLADWHRHWNQFTEALPFCLESLAISRELTAKEPAYMLLVAIALHDLGEVQCSTGRFSEAEASYMEALAIYRALVALDMDSYLPDVAMTLSNLGLLQFSAGCFSEAEISYTESLAIVRELAVNEPNSHLPMMATTLLNFGLLQFSTGRFTEAEVSYTESLAIFRELTANEPGAHLPNMTKALLNLGLLQQHTDLFSEAEASFTESLVIFRELAANEPGAHLPNVAMISLWLGNLQCRTSRFTEAELPCTESLAICRDLASQEPSAHLPKMAIALFNLGLLQYSTSRFPESESSLMESLTISRELSANEPNAHLPILAEILNCLGFLQDGMGHFTESESFLTESLAIRRDLAIQEPNVHLLGVARTLLNLGNLQRSTGRFFEAEVSHTEARLLAKKYPDHPLSRVVLRVES